MSLLKDLVILDPNSSNSKRSAPMKMERLVGGLTQVFLKRRDWTASVGCKADTGWDKWLQSWSLCVAAAEPPWNSLYSRWCPSPLPALHMFLLKDLVMIEPTPNSFANKQMKCELCGMLNIKRCYGNKTETSLSPWMRTASDYTLCSWELYAYLRLGSFESGCMHNLLKSIPAPRCLKSWTC